MTYQQRPSKFINKIKLSLSKIFILIFFRCWKPKVKSIALWIFSILESGLLGVSPAAVDLV